MSSDAKIVSFFKTWLELGLYVINGKRDADEAKDNLQRLINEPEPEPESEDWEKNFVRRLKRAITEKNETVQYDFICFESLETYVCIISCKQVKCSISPFQKGQGWRQVSGFIYVESPERYMIPLTSEDRKFFYELLQNSLQNKINEKKKRVQSVLLEALPGGIKIKG